MTIQQPEEVGNPRDACKRECRSIRKSVVVCLRACRINALHARWWSKTGDRERERELLWVVQAIEDQQSGGPVTVATGTKSNKMYLG